MHSMTNLAVVNISYLKFSSSARRIMDSDRECAAAATAIAVICKKRKRRIKKQCRQKRSDWVKDWLTKRNEPGFERTLLPEFRYENEDEYRKFLRMTAENFDELLDLIDFPKTYFFPQSTNKFLYQLNALVLSSHV